MKSFLEIKEESEFQAIAKSLLNQYAIETNDSLFRMTEIEFYWNSLTHVDNSTYKRTHFHPSSGQWFFHYSGVDIALRNEETGGYGGILIRSIYDVRHEKAYKGPQVCVMRLFSGANVFDGNIKVRIIENAFPELKIARSERIGLENNARANGADKLQYRFTITLGKKV